MPVTTLGINISRKNKKRQWMEEGKKKENGPRMSKGLVKTGALSLCFALKFLSLNLLLLLGPSTFVQSLSLHLYHVHGLFHVPCCHVPCLAGVCQPTSDHRIQHLYSCSHQNFVVKQFFCQFIEFVFSDINSDTIFRHACRFKYVQNFFSTREIMINQRDSSRIYNQ